jgi:hypothetical protein
MIRPGRAALWCVAAALTACGVSERERPTSRLDDDSRREVYDRTDLDFEAGVLYKPTEGRAEEDAWTLAPLLIEESPMPGVDGADEPSGPAVVYYERTITLFAGREYAQWSYLWSYPDTGTAQGVRMTIGADGFPSIYEVLHDTSGARLFFVADALEQAATRKHGPRLPDRRFAVEPDVERAPDVVVGGTLESGPTPLGPFVYVRREDRNVNTVICRCMPSRVISIPSTATYDLEPLDPAGVPQAVAELSESRAADLDRSLRLAVEVLRGSAE